MQARYKWLLLPPAIALILFMGPLRNIGLPSTEGLAQEIQTAGDPQTTEEPGTMQDPQGVGQGLVPMPDAWQVTSTLLGILLLGGIGIMLLARLRRGRSPKSGDLMTLCQSLRLSQRHSLHAVQFDHNLLLLGECDGHLSLIKLGPDPEQRQDEELLAARDADEGAVPRDMVIPHPAGSTTGSLQSGKVRVDRHRPSLDEFKDLLRRVKSGARQ